MMLDLLRDRWLARRRRLDQRMFYRRGPGGWPLVRVTLLVIFLAGFGMFVEFDFDHGFYWTSGPAQRPMFYIAYAWIAWLLLRRGLTYRRGWMEGRTALRSSMYEATLRDMTPEEWMNAELDRDARTLGYDTFEDWMDEPHNSDSI